MHTWEQALINCINADITMAYRLVKIKKSHSFFSPVFFFFFLFSSLFSRLLIEHRRDVIQMALSVLTQTTVEREIKKETTFFTRFYDFRIVACYIGWLSHHNFHWKETVAEQGVLPPGAKYIWAPLMV